MIYKIFKSVIIIGAFFSMSEIYAQKRDVEINFFIKDSQVSNVLYYLVDNNQHIKLLDFRNGQVSFPDTISRNSVAIMLKYKDHETIFPIYDLSSVKKIDIYFDNRIFGNTIKKKLRINRFGNLFSKEYYILFSDSGDFLVTYSPTKNYTLDK
ncbi:hypothetical protein HUK80_13500 [Flavobacterium sp. MAH-1]|uniref:Uncharacterized protein n=1 Tax=Flavobacterium agri TaxID=2743471 RepID=A0A7Y8Y4V2_9FLAO|nr:hypothetical protein [Flavobacterium agri]NUY81914.1 hypothetical protein [Flavobacterium agri]NYA71938.1 hypothetical protein [Flavobacterium agri]